MGTHRTIVPLLVVLLAVAARAEAPHVGGWVDTYVAWNGNRPADGASFVPGTGTTAKRANEFSVNQAAVELQQAPAPFGYHLVFGFGTGFDVVHSGELPGVGVGHDAWRHLLTASVAYVVPAGRGLTLEGGLYPSHIGFESFPSQANWNYTRSWLGEFSPYYQAGVKASYAFTEAFSAQLHLVNGWQKIADDNEGKAIGVQLAYAGERMSATWNGFAGPERANDGAHWRLFSDAIAQLNVGTVAIAASFDAGRQSLPGGQDATWWGLAGFARWAIDPKVALAARAEAYRDLAGVVSGVPGTLSEATVTCEWRPVEQLILKLEGRYDHATVPAFHLHDVDATGAPELGTDQLLAVAGAVATF